MSPSIFYNSLSGLSARFVFTNYIHQSPVFNPVSPSTRHQTLASHSGLNLSFAFFSHIGEYFTWFIQGDLSYKHSLVGLLVHFIAIILYRISQSHRTLQCFINSFRLPIFHTTIPFHKLFVALAVNFCVILTILILCEIIRALVNSLVA